MRCPKCGCVNPDGAAVCQTCGLDFAALPESARLPRSKGWIIFRAVAAVLLFIGVMFLCQFCVMMGYTSSVVVNLGVGEAVAAGNTDFMTEEFVDSLAEAITAHSVEILLIANLLTLLAVCLIFRLRRRVPTEEFALRSVNPYRLPGFALLGVSVNIAAAGVISFLPLSESTVDSFESQYASLFASNLFLEILTAAVVTPIVEEIIFRGIAMTRLIPAVGTPAAVVISAAIFAIAHWTPIAVGYTVVVGVLLALIYVRTRSILPTIIVHMFFNLTPYWLDQIDQKGFTVLFVISILVTVWLILTQIVRFPNFTDVYYDTTDRLVLRDGEERRIAREVRACRANPDDSRLFEKIGRLALEWNKYRAEKERSARENARKRTDGKPAEKPGPGEEPIPEKEPNPEKAPNPEKDPNPGDDPNPEDNPKTGTDGDGDRD